MSETRAALFDIDGTLVDSNYLHVEAWSRTFVDSALKVDEWRIHRCIGMDSGKLLSTLIGDDAERLGNELKRLHTKHYSTFAPRLRTFDRARDLIRAVAGHGVSVVLATSAPENELEQLRKVLDIEDSLAEVTSAEDVETAKPDPGIVQVALDKAGATTSRAMFLGDSVWDVLASKRAGVRCVGLLSGGFGAAELLDAGAVAVYDDVAQLLGQLDDSPLASLWNAE